MRIFFVLIVLMLSRMSYAQEVVITQENDKKANVSAIDEAEKECVGDYFGAMGVIRECAGKAQQQWMDAVKQSYSELMGLLSENAKSNLMKSQKAWESFYQAELRNIETYCDFCHGTYFVGARAELRRDLVKSRAEFLFRYLETVKEEESLLEEVLPKDKR